jgi:2-amino-4-hydroxy-6-hydroxymethyldihydropteridine diphosphokinase
MTTAEIELPPWSIASPRRRSHIARVTELALSWASSMRIDRAERDAWRDATRWHDALRDANDDELRAIVPHLDWPASLLHGPAAAARLAEDGERRASVLEAIYWHTVGNARWDRTGRMLYMADYLEPGRKFEREQRAVLAAQVPNDLDGTFREIVDLRLGPRIAAKEKLLPESIALWESVQ